MSKLYWEDLAIGQVLEYGAHTVTREEVIEFAREFDAQPFHVDDEAAAQSPYGGLIASGWQTAGFCMRMLVDNVLSKARSLGAPGVEWLRWRQPVRPGDELRVRHHVLEKRVSKSRPYVGFVKNRFEVLNQHDAVVMEMVTQSMFQRRLDPDHERGAA